MRVVDGLGDVEITNEVFPRAIQYIRRLYIFMYNGRVKRVYVVQSKGNVVEHYSCRGLPLRKGFEVCNLYVEALFANSLEDIDVASYRPTLGGDVSKDMFLTSY